VVPLAVFIGIFAWTAHDYIRLYDPPRDALPVYVVARQWMWKLQHRNGRREINELHVPLGQPVLLKMTSQDAIHSFYVPAFRLKQDVLPGRYTSLWFTATQLGEFRLFEDRPGFLNFSQK
jgi:cytochrome c oxidase subunit 2